MWWALLFGGGWSGQALTYVHWGTTGPWWPTGTLCSHSLQESTHTGLQEAAGSAAAYGPSRGPAATAAIGQVARPKQLLLQACSLSQAPRRRKGSLFPAAHFYHDWLCSPSFHLIKEETCFPLPSPLALFHHN